MGAIAMWTMMTVNPGRKSFAIFSKVQDALVNKGLIYKNELAYTPEIDWEKTQAMSVFLYHFSSALTKIGLTTYEGPLYRWQGNPETFEVGTPKQKRTFVATTVKKPPPQGFASKEVVVEIYG